MNAPVFKHAPGNQFMSLAESGVDDAGRRAVLAELISTAETAEADAQALASQISAAVGHSQTIAGELAAAQDATHAARASASRSMADWIVGGRVGPAPDTAAAIVAAEQAQAEAAATAQTVSGAVDALRQDLADANGRATDARAAAKVAVHRIALAEAETLARSILAKEAETAAERRRLMAFVRRLGGSMSAPAVVYQAANPKAPNDDNHSPAYQAERAAWDGFLEALARDADAQPTFPG